MHSIFASFFLQIGTTVIYFIFFYKGSVHDPINNLYKVSFNSKSPYICICCHDNAGNKPMDFSFHIHTQSGSLQGGVMGKLNIPFCISYIGLFVLHMRETHTLIYLLQMELLLS